MLNAPMGFRGGIIVVSLAIATAWQGGQPPSATPPSNQPQATFKAGVEVVRLDVTVLDQERRPLRGLTANDFVVLEKGKPQPILDVVPVEVPAAAASTAAWMHDAGNDIASNESDIRRLVVIVMDDARTGIDHGESLSARKIAHAIVDELGPADLAAVAFTFMGTVQNLTADRARLRRAIDSYLPKNWLTAGPPLGCAFKYGGCVVSALRTVGDVFQAAPQGRKLVMLIGSDGALDVRTDPGTQMTPVQEMFRSLQRANTTVYAFDPYGLRGVRSIGGHDLDAVHSGIPPANGRTLEEQSRQGVEDLQSITDATGGRTIAGTNTPEVEVPAVFQQNSLYYIVAFRSEPSRTPRDLRKVEVRVNRSGAVIQSRIGYFAPVPNKERRRGHTPTALESVLEVGIPNRSVPIRFSAAPFAIPGSRRVALILTSRVRSPVIEEEPAPIELLAAAFDKDWKERGVVRQTLAAKEEFSASGDHETLMRMPLRPGRYEIRVAAQTAAGRGSVFEDMTVPDFFKEALSMSGVLLERSPSGAANRNVVADLVPITPTAVREFSPSDRVSAFVRIYQKGTARPAGVVLTSRVLNQRDEIVLETTTDLEAARFSTQREADHRLSLPLDRMTPGEYLLTIEGAAADKTVRQEVRFGVH